MIMFHKILIRSYLFSRGSIWFLAVLSGDMILLNNIIH